MQWMYNFHFSLLVQYRVEAHNPETDVFEPLPVNLGKYRNLSLSNFDRLSISPLWTGLGMQTEVKDPEDNIILSRIYSAEGEIDTHISHSKINSFSISLSQVAFHLHRMHLVNTPFAYPRIVRHGLAGNNCVSISKCQPANTQSITFKLHRRRSWAKSNFAFDNCSIKLIRS